MYIPHVDSVKEVIGAQAVEALRKIFESRIGEPPSVPIQRFRADHDGWLQVLDALENRYSLIERNRDCNQYLIRSYALPLIDSTESKLIMTIMDEIYRKLPELYKEHLTQPIELDMLCGSDISEKHIKEAVYYLSMSHGITCGMTTGFPYTQNSTFCISESVLSKKSISQVLSEYYEWHFVNPKNQITWLDNFDSAKLTEESFFFRTNLSSDKPDWYELLDDTQKALISEIDRAIKNELKALPTIGLRTLLETIMVEKIGDCKGFKEQVKRFTAEGFVTQKMAAAMTHVLDAGSASAHRAYFPSKEDLTTCVELVKHLMHGTYILSPKVDRVAENTPKRG